MHRSLRLAVTAIATGALAGSPALASALIAPPVADVSPVDVSAPVVADVATPGDDDAVAGLDVAELEQLAAEQGVAAQLASLLDGPDGLGAGQLYVGAAKTNLDPLQLADDVTTDPAGEGHFWETDYDKCAVLSESVLANIAELPDHLMTAGSTWPENPNCLYQGGFGIGPMNPIVGFDEELGLWARSISISDGTDTLVLTVLDAEGWLWDYANKCERCGAKQIGEDVAASLTEAGYPVSKDGIVLASTHSHAGMDFLGVWGFVPDWYMEDVTEAIRATMTEAVTSAVPALVEVGEATERRFNSDRRDTYRSAEEQHHTWLVASDATTGEAIATLGAYAGHPTSFGNNDGIAHADWPGYYVEAAEERIGGVGVFMMTGLGNLSGSGDKFLRGPELVSQIPLAGEGEPIDGTDIRLTQALYRSPVTNAPLTALGVPGFADRVFDPIPAAVSVGKSEGSPCVSASEYSVELPALGAWIGEDFVMTTGPGELFANGTNTIRDESGARYGMPFAQANDALGYMPQSFEIENPANLQGLGFAVGGFAMVNYEDSYAIDRCVGDLWLETTLDALASIR